MRTFITAEQAMKLIVDGSLVHTFRSGGAVLIGLDWTRDHLEKVMAGLPPNRIELAGETARSMKHGVCVWDEEDRCLFVETHPDRLAGFRSEICDVDECAGSK